MSNASVRVPTDRSPHAPPPPHCLRVWCARIPPQAAAGLPNVAPMNSCCWGSLSPPGHCHSNWHPGPGLPLRRSPGEGSPAGQAQIQNTNNMGLIIRETTNRSFSIWGLGVGGWGCKNILRLSDGVYVHGRRIQCGITSSANHGSFSNFLE